MNYNKLSDVQRLALDVYRGDIEKRSNGHYSHIHAEDEWRKMLLDSIGGEFTYRNFQKKKHEFFGLIEETMPVLIHEGLQKQFDEFVDYRDVAFGDKNVFMSEDYHLFIVSKVAGGTNNAERQRLEKNSFSISTGWHEVKVYEEFERFVSGKTDWAKTVSKVIKSFVSQIKADVLESLVKAYNALTAPKRVTGSYDRTKLNTLVQFVEAATDEEVVIVGTKIALQNVTPQYVAASGQMVEDRNSLGYFKNVDGYDMMEIKQAIKPGTDEFAVPNDFLLVIPKSDLKILKVVLEGSPIIEETTSATNSDNSVEFMYKQKYGVGVLTSTVYGAYLIG